MVRDQDKENPQTNKGSNTGTNGDQEPSKSSAHEGENGLLIGRVASPIRNESTSSRFFFWVPRDSLVEKTQLVWTESTFGTQTVRFYGVVEEVYRRSRKQSINEEVDMFDGDLN